MTDQTPTPEPTVAELLAPLAFYQGHIERQINTTKRTLTHMENCRRHDHPQRHYQLMESIVNAFEDYLNKLKTAIKQKYQDIIKAILPALRSPDMVGRDTVIKECKEKCDELENRIHKEVDDLNNWSYGPLGEVNPRVGKMRAAVDGVMIALFGEEFRDF